MFPGVRGTVELSQRTFERVRRSLGEGRTGGLGLAATRPGTLELYEIGTFCRIVTHSFLGQPRPGTEQGEAGARVRVVLEGRTRFRVLYYTQVSPLHITTVQLLEELPAPEGITVSNLALRVQRELLELLGQPKAENQPPWPASTSLLADVAGAALRPLPLEERQRILETMDVQCRLELVLPLLQREVETKRAQESKGDGMCWPTLARTGEVPGIGRGEAVDNTEEVDEVSQLKAQISAAGLPGDALRLATRELQRLQAMQPSHPEYAVASKYLETLPAVAGFHRGPPRARKHAGPARRGAPRPGAREEAAAGVHRCAEAAWRHDWPHPLSARASWHRQDFHWLFDCTGVGKEVPPHRPWRHAGRG